MTDANESQASVSDYPDAQDLICTQQKEIDMLNEHATNKHRKRSRSRQKDAIPEESSVEVILDSSDSEIGSEYHTKCSIAPSKQKRKSGPSRQQVEAVVTVPDDESSDSSPSPPSPVKLPESSKEKKSKLNLKAIFAYHFRGRKFKTAAHRNFRSTSRKRKTETETKTRHERTYMPTGRPPLTASPQEQKKRLLHRGFEFPFVEKHYGTKHIPLKMVLDYEQAATKGYLRYIEMLKYEEHLKKALKALQASEDLERECLAVRKHKYLDDEGPISPIQEMNDDNSLGADNQDDFDVRVVDNSCFILSSRLPNKKKSKTETKRAKSTGVVEVEKKGRAAAKSGLQRGSLQ
ncbi:TATA box-binding protein-associated factor RNA polymerase I subunit D isoform X1 [Cygnus olor]|uniref:TATA box-binding protein-associated factor RNA polymerase I subunit D isoform X1 n=1 Tax=Cygnus olor TaxID=8869 RepID=UPI001ADEBD0F|nr:TATA box-binding protein-associated factor RNA polymerase I subunit D isoform X1 [Cygnus olor]XP_040400175.1 TATA box-binding protein-associated factor RNA polymerase I subunit D isoform X1 [Cygnus olor]XP_040400176.1 TATA box-binding protein-associated factor RNA polymerase I subunit D isoform X1 [Cygnus olor]XP_040400177.1 TATA box-binding protein-associated factor RNA polymerase I subunit D isoform X1 [Cygnus olor]XP_040400178.1 TATA box-binding protein-associated factor RNA polymerase I 